MPLSRARTLFIASLLTSALPLSAAHAENELMGYVGGAIGQSQIDVSSLNFSAHATGWKAVIGVRALSAFGAEAEYVDLGRPRGSSVAGRLETQASGPAVFGLAYLPLPLPYLDVYAKAGIANVQQRATVDLAGGGSACAAGLGCDGLNRSESEFAWGGGAQIKTGSVAVRVEFEQYRAAGGALSFGTVGLLWTFP